MNATNAVYIATGTVTAACTVLLTGLGFFTLATSMPSDPYAIGFYAAFMAIFAFISARSFDEAEIRETEREYDGIDEARRAFLRGEIGEMEMERRMDYHVLADDTEETERTEKRELVARQ